MNRNPAYAVVPMLYAAAIVASIFAGGFVPVIVVGGILVGIFFTAVGARNGTARSWFRRR